MTSATRSRLRRRNRSAAASCVAPAVRRRRAGAAARCGHAAGLLEQRRRSSRRRSRSSRACRSVAALARRAARAGRRSRCAVSRPWRDAGRLVAGGVRVAERDVEVALGGGGGGRARSERGARRRARAADGAGHGAASVRRAPMRALVQRVTRARVTVDGDDVGAIGAGLLVLLGVTHDDDEAVADRLADKVRALRVFPDADGPDERAARRPRGARRQPVHALRRRAQGQPPELRRRRAGPSTPSRSTSASARASARRAACSARTWRSSSSNDGPVTAPARASTRCRPTDRLVCRFAAEPPQEGAALRPLGRPPAPGVPRRVPARRARRGRGPRRAGRHRLVPRPHVGRAHVRPGDRAHDDRLRALRLRLVRARRRRRTSPTTSRATADYTDELAEEHPDWQLDLNDEVLGGWRGEDGNVAAMTLVWGRPLVDGGAVVTAELADLAVDQCALVEEPLHADRARRLPRRHARREAVGRARRASSRRESLYVRVMDVEEAIRTPPDPQGVRRRARSTATTLDELFELARWAPNHHLTNPWRFRVARPAARSSASRPRPRPESAREARPRAHARRRLERRRRGGPRRDARRAAYIVLLAAHARGLATYWRTPAVLRRRRGPRRARPRRGRAGARPAAPRHPAPGAARRPSAPRRGRRDVPRLRRDARQATLHAQVDLLDQYTPLRLLERDRGRRRQ